ncbi:dihydrouridine synthase 3 [Arctopsyche grandis]|uniref:dihydrouridine synthase 3 n=1 Tax=Arctopsyche grandis TaxID=121162 RepID=UPI00406DA0E3
MTNNGFCAIKPEYIISKRDTPVSQKICENLSEDQPIDETVPLQKVSEPPFKKQKVENAEKEQTSHKDKKNDRKKMRGQNKSRPKPVREAADSRPCSNIINVHQGETPKPCTFKQCSFIHDPVEYLKKKPTDISVNGEDCYVFSIRGECPWGISCRYGSLHLSPEGHNLVNSEKFAKWSNGTTNMIEFETLLKLQRKKYDFSSTEDLVNSVNKQTKEKNKKVSNENCNGDPAKVENKEKHELNSGTVTDEDLVKTRSSEKKKIEWRDKLYLGPLTTLGNLPFRRICKEFGADITCGEMAMSDVLLKGAKQEWALVKRHTSEDIFGVQICGSNPYTISKSAQVIQKDMTVDFVDLNLGCPIDLVYKKGGGCGMLLRTNVLETSVMCASRVLDVPFTVKTRTGVHQETKIAHHLAPKFFKWGASMLTVHGRSREQRYTRFSDWKYIDECAKAASPNPVFGNGDILSYEDYVLSREKAPNISGVMICRGGLIKPWLFTEIKEKRLWDIRSSERFDILKRYVNYGLEHWGSDSRGVENTRRFLLEWCSFLHRYIPVGLLEKPPQKINERPPYYVGRDDLETLMASSNCADWVKISEMLLGPVPDGFQFLPKHKANSFQ